MASLIEQIQITADLEQRASDAARLAWNTYVDARNEQVRLSVELRELRSRQKGLLDAAGVSSADVPTQAMPVMPGNANDCRNC